MQNVAPSHSLVRRSRRLFELAIVVVAAGVFLAVFGLALFAVPLTSSLSSTFSLYNIGRTLLLWGGVALAVLGVLFAFRALTWKTENDTAFRVGEYLKQHLNDNFTYIRNISGRQLGYIDAVLVGPPGVLVFRTLDQTGRFLNEKAKWMKANSKGEWSPLLRSPSQEVIDDIKSLRDYLALRELAHVPIFGVVVFTQNDPEVHLILKQPIVPATHLTSLVMRLKKNYLAKDRIDASDVDAVVELLYTE